VNAVRVDKCTIVPGDLLCFGGVAGYKVGQLCEDMAQNYLIYRLDRVEMTVAKAQEYVAQGDVIPPPLLKALMTGNRAWLKGLYDHGIVLKIPEGQQLPLLDAMLDSNEDCTFYFDLFWGWTLGLDPYLHLVDRASHVPVRVRFLAKIVKIARPRGWECVELVEAFVLFALDEGTADPTHIMQLVLDLEVDVGEHVTQLIAIAPKSDLVFQVMYDQGLTVPLDELAKRMARGPCAFVFKLLTRMAATQDCSSVVAFTWGYTSIATRCLRACVSGTRLDIAPWVRGALDAYGTGAYRTATVRDGLRLMCAVDTTPDVKKVLALARHSPCCVLELLERRREMLEPHLEAVWAFVREHHSTTSLSAHLLEDLSRRWPDRMAQICLNDRDCQLPRLLHPACLWKMPWHCIKLAINGGTVVPCERLMEDDGDRAVRFGIFTYCIAGGLNLKATLQGPKGPEGLSHHELLFHMAATCEIPRLAPAFKLLDDTYGDAVDNLVGLVPCIARPVGRMRTWLRRSPWILAMLSVKGRREVKGHVRTVAYAEVLVYHVALYI